MLRCVRDRESPHLTEHAREQEVSLDSWMDHVNARTCVAAARPTHVPENAKGLASCYDVISMLEHQLRTSRALLDALKERPSPVTQTSMSLVVDYCAELRAEAVEVASRTDVQRNRAHHDTDTATLTGVLSQRPLSPPGSKGNQSLTPTRLRVISHAVSLDAVANYDSRCRFCSDSHWPLTGSRSMRDECRLRHLLSVKSNNGPAATDKTICISNHVPPQTPLASTVPVHGHAGRRNSCR
jgi:hypothetical protein